MGTDRQREVGGRVLEIAAHLARRGHVVLLFDLRGAGQSGGTRFTLGAREGRDVSGAIDFLTARGLAPHGVDLLGYSMGAATALLLAPADARVQAVAADSGYAGLRDVLEAQLPRFSGLPPLFTAGTVALARPMLGLDAGALRPVDGAVALAARRVPLLVIHGEADDMVPVSHGRRLAAAFGPGAQTLFVPGAAHVASYAAQPATYLARLATFFAAA
jgi:pimeloyl-ACP methyl ester carboxylesterase